MNIHLIFLFIIISASTFEFFGDYNFKIFSRTNNYFNLSYGIIIYFLMIGIIIYALKFSNIIYMNTLWDATSIIIEMLFAYLLVGEKLTNLYQIYGFIIILIGIVLFNIGKIPY